MSADPDSDCPRTFPFREGNDVELLSNGCEIFPAMLTAIGQARRSICLETYIYWDGLTGDRFADALCAQARAGLDVRVILDWFGCYKLSETLVDRMKDAGVQIVTFRPLRWYSLRRLNHRSHRKILVVDGRIGFIGGVGIADEWQGDAEDEHSWRDNHYRLTGPLVADLQDVFFLHWQQNEPVARDNPAFYPELSATGSVRGRIVAAEPSDGPIRMRDTFLELIARADSHLAVVTPYFMPGKRLLKALHDARSRGVAVQVLTCGKHTDEDVVRNASRHCWGGLLEDHIRIYEYRPTLLHTKALLVDQEALFVGSANFDSRSTRINSEANLLIEDKAITARHWQQLTHDLERSRAIDFKDWKSRGFHAKLIDRCAHLFRDQL